MTTDTTRTNRRARKPAGASSGSARKGRRTGAVGPESETKREQSGGGAARTGAAARSEATAAGVRQVDIAAVSGATAQGASDASGHAPKAQAEAQPKSDRRSRRGGRRRRTSKKEGTDEKKSDTGATDAGRKSEEARAKPPASGGDAKQGTSRKSSTPTRGRRRRAKTKPTDDKPASEKAERAAQAEQPKGDRAARDEEPEPSKSAFAEFDVERAPLEKPGSRAMVINVSGEDECRIAVLNEGRLEELFIERGAAQSLVGNIYKGRITNVESSIQAVFVDFGQPKHGFLHVSDVQPQYFPNHKGGPEEVGRKIPRQARPPIQKCFRRGQEVLVQVIKQGVGTKGPTLTTYLSIPGQYLVMLPGMARHGVSRKIEDDADRKRMRDVLNELSLPPDAGVIVRTAGLDKTKRDLQRDLNYVSRLWKAVKDKIRERPAPAEVYRESDLITRTLRDIYTSDFNRIIVDDMDAAKRVRSFLELATPRSKPNIEVYSRREPLFHRLGVEDEIELINTRHVPLPSGGTLVIDTTEAMVAIDVNSGKFRTPDDPEETALRINLEAAEEIARQLRLRDLGGLIVCDFIDLRLDRNKRKVERALRDALKKHKERARLLRMSAFGLIEITRQRQGPSIKQNTYLDCPHCHGSGVVKTPESVVLDVMRTIQLATHREPVQRVIVTVAGDVANEILNRKRSQLHRIESETGKVIVVKGDPHFTADQIDCVGEDERGQIVNIRPVESTRQRS